MEKCQVEAELPFDFSPPPPLMLVVVVVCENVELNCKRLSGINLIFS